jgi:hypothetical protein
MRLLNVFLCVVLAPSAALAQDLTPATTGSAGDAAHQGVFLPFSMGATVAGGEGTSAAISTFSGYDTAYSQAQFQAIGELRVWGPIALRIGAAYAPTQDSRVRPTAGVHVQLLKQSTSGVDGSVAVSYKPEGLTQPEGEVESVLAIGRSFGALTAIANLAYGQDPDGHERDGEARISGLYALSTTVQGGIDARTRFSLGSQLTKIVPNHEAVFDLVAGPLIEWAPARLIEVSAQAGFSAARFPLLNAPAQLRTGAIALGGVGFVF